MRAFCYDLGVISRYFVIGLALIAAALRARDHAWIETAGLGTLAGGLILLRLADARQQPALKKAAWVLFAVTLVAMGIVFKRDYLR
jgi:hypothetical protein